LTQIFPTYGVYHDTIASTEGSKLIANKPSGDGTPAATEFTFIPADSTFMQYAQSDSLVYGHIALASNTDLHLTVDLPGRADGQTPYLNTKFVTEDSSQLLQFWSYDLSNKIVTFIGRSNRTVSPTYTGPFAPARSTEDTEEVKLASQGDTFGRFFLRPAN